MIIDDISGIIGKVAEGGNKVACCKADKFGWCRELRTVYAATEGEYCVFHAPKGKKAIFDGSFRREISYVEFNKLIFERINNTKKYEERCNLSGTIFEGEIRFNYYDEANPLPSISLNSATFNDDTDFLGTVFFGDADFSHVIFNGRAYFSNACFFGKAEFFRTEFSGATTFFNTYFHEKTYFVESIFNRKIDFMETEFNAEIDFVGSFINHDITFNKTVIKLIMYFQYININAKIRFEKINFKNISLLDTDTRRIDFINCHFKKKKGRRLLYDEINLFTINNNDDYGNRIKKVETLYRRLKQKYKEEHDYPEVSNWHYGEKEMYRKGSIIRRYIPVSLSNLYWLSSGYGERPVRAGLLLVVLLITIYLSIGLAGVKPIGCEEVEILTLNNMSMANHLMHAISTLESLIFKKPTYYEPAGVWGTFIRLIFKIIFPIQITLFVLAVRNKFRR